MRNRYWISISANRFKGVRAALCHDVKTAEQARKHNDANILAIGARHINFEDAINCVNAFLKTDFEGQRHIKRVEKLDNKVLEESSVNTNDPELEKALAKELKTAKYSRANRIRKLYIFNYNALSRFCFN